MCLGGCVVYEPIGKDEDDDAEIAHERLRSTLRAEQLDEFIARRQRQRELEEKQEWKPRRQVLIANLHADGERNQNRSHPQARC